MQVITHICHGFFSSQTQSPAENPFPKLPPELIVRIFSHFNAYDLTKLAPTCRLFHFLSRDKALDIAKLNVFKKMHSERIGPSFNYFAFFLRGQEMIFGDRKHDNQKTFEILNLRNLKKAMVVPKQAIRKGELDDFYYFIYFDDALRIKFIHKQGFTPFSDLKLCDKNVKIGYIQSSANTVVICVDQCLACIQDGNRLSFIKGLEFENDRFDKMGYFNLCEKQLVVSRYRDVRDRTRTLLQNIDLITGKVTCQAITKKFYNKMLVTDRYVVLIEQFSEKADHAYIDVYDSKFVLMNFIHVSVQTDAFNYNERYESDEFYYAYEDRLVIFVNMHNLLFYNLKRGDLVQKYDLKRSIKYGSMSYFDITRVSAYKDKLVASNGNEIELYDLHTGKRMHRFLTSAHPIWLKLSKDYELLYTIYDRQKRNYFYAHFCRDEKRIYPSIRQRKEERKKIVEAAKDPV